MTTVAGAGTHVAQQREPARARKHQVEHYQVEALAAQQSPRFVPVGGRSDGVALAG